MSKLTRSVVIQPEGSSSKYDSLLNWGLAIENNNIIGAPVKETHYVTVPGAPIDIDLSEALTGHPVYKYRPITINFGGIRNPSNWDTVISDLRNKIDGRVCKLIFDNDKGYYWRGRVSIDNFDRMRTLGRFTLNVEHADPFKYDVYDSTDNWLWDPFDFENGIIRYIPEFEVSGITEFKFPRVNKPTVPIFDVKRLGGGEYPTTLIVYDARGEGHLIRDVGEHRFPAIQFDAGTEGTVIIEGEATMQIKYRGGSL